jgi:hypothetical protein
MFILRVLHYAGHIRPERPGDLHSVRTHATRRTVNQNLPHRLNSSLVAQTLQRSEAWSEPQK